MSDGVAAPAAAASPAVIAPAAPAAPANIDYAALVASGAVPSEAHARAALERVGTVQAEPAIAAQPDPTGRPTDVPEKFWDPVKRSVNTAALLKSYQELERSRSAAPAPAAEPAAQAPAAADPAAPAAPAAAEKPEGVKIDRPAAETAAPLTAAFEAARTQYAEKGELDEATVDSLVKAGVPKATLDTYLAGVRALEASAVTAAHEAAGGKETFDQAVAYARASLSDAELESYNALVSNPATQKAGIEWLVGKFRAANPTEGTFVRAEAAASSGDLFRSSAELTEAMRDPKYSRDPAFRQSVAEKLQRSKAAGTLNTGVQHFTNRR